MTFTKESQMREPVKEYLASCGFHAAVEFWLHGSGRTDIVAGGYARREGRKIPRLLRAVAVELKLHDVGGVLAQATTNRHHCDWSYIAMPADRIGRMRDQTLERIRTAGVGLLSVGDTVVEIIPPVIGSGLAEHRNQVKTLWRRVKHSMPQQTRNQPQPTD